MLVIKLEDDYTDFTMEFLNEDEHYILAARNSSDLDAKIKWAKDHDTVAHQIALSSSAFASKFLSEEAELCYWYTLLSEYSKLQKNTHIRPHKNARLVEQHLAEMTMAEFLFLLLAFILTVMGYTWILCCVYLTPLPCCSSTTNCCKFTGLTNVDKVHKYTGDQDRDMNV